MKKTDTDFRALFSGFLSPERICLHEKMDRHTSFRVGGEAACMLRPASEEEISAILAVCAREHLTPFVMGNGSNLLVSDEGFDGVILQLEKNFSLIRVTGDRIFAQAGALLGAVSRAARDASLTGLEFAGGIPGSLGGAVMMNAGAYGGEMKQVIREVRAIDRTGRLHLYGADELGLSYRMSRFAGSGEIVTGALLSLEEGEQEAITARMKELARQRALKQPIELPSAGSTFKRPEGYFAGRLIEDSGLGGYRVGGAQVSEKHKGFVVNTGGASAADIYRLMCDVQRIVYEKYGVRLEREVRLLGAFPGEEDAGRDKKA